MGGVTTPLNTKTMYRIPKYEETSMELENTKEGETIEEKVTRLIQNKEPIKDGAPIIWTERSHGVNPAYNIRTDRWEIAVDALDRLRKSKENTEKLATAENVGQKPEIGTSTTTTTTTEGVS